MLSPRMHECFASQMLSHRGLERFGRLMYEAHTSLRLDFEESCAELDTMVDWPQSCRESMELGWQVEGSEETQSTVLSAEWRVSFEPHSRT